MTCSSALAKFSQERTDATFEQVKDALIELDDEQQKIPRRERKYPTKKILDIVDRNAGTEHKMSRSALTRNQRIRQLIAQYRNQEVTSTMESELRLSEFAGWTPPKREPDRTVAARKRSYMTLSNREVARRVVGLEELQIYFHHRRIEFEIRLAAGPTWPNNDPYPNTPFWPSPNEIRLAAQRWQRYINKTCKQKLVSTLIKLELAIAEDMEHLLALDLTYEQH